MNAIIETNLTHLPLIHQGKVRDIYQVDNDHLLIIATDRLSAFDVVFPTPIPNKGAILASISNFWFKFTKDIIPNHCSDINLQDVFSSTEEYQTFKHHAVVVKKMDNLPVEAIARGYIIGSGWKDYQKTGALCGIELPKNLRQAEKLPQPLFTPSTKATVGDHDENISFEETVKLIGTDMADRIKQVTLEIYQKASIYAKQRGIIIADTKFEFGLDKAGDLTLIDEVLTPDSSRFWAEKDYKTGTSPDSYDKQIIRDYLETTDWNKQPPAPQIPQKMIDKAYQKYREIEQKLTQR